MCARNDSRWEWGDFPRQETRCSASKVHSKGHVAVVDSNGGHIIFHNIALAGKIRQFVQKMRSSLNLVQYVCIMRTAPTSDTPKIQQHAHTHEQSGVDACKTTVGGPSAPADGGGPLASEVCNCLPAQSPATKLQIRRVSRFSGEMQCMPIDSEIVDAGIDDGSNEVQQPMLLRSDVDPPSWRWNTIFVASGHAQHRTWCDARMRARLFDTLTRRSREKNSCVQGHAFGWQANARACHSSERCFEALRTRLSWSRSCCTRASDAGSTDPAKACKHLCFPSTRCSCTICLVRNKVRQQGQYTSKTNRKAKVTAACAAVE